MQEALNNLENSDENDIEASDQVLTSISQIQPEMKIFSRNPYEYGNYLDFFVQRYNVLALQRKMNVLPTYAHKINSKNMNIIHLQYEALAYKMMGIDAAEEEDLAAFAEKYENSDLSPIQLARLEHKIHEKYRVQRNTINNTIYNQVTSIADEAYLKKIKPYAEKVYNDCMGHIMLISDEEVQKSLENRLYTQIFGAVSNSLNNVLLAHQIAKWQEPFECCDLPEMEAEEKRSIEEAEAAARDQAKNDVEARKKFEAAEIDKNSELYKRYIKPYEIEINTIVFKGTISPYKSSWNILIGYDPKAGFGGGVNFGKMENHYRGTTTYDGGITIVAKGSAGGDTEGKISATIGASLTSGTDGKFSPNDIDIYRKAEVSGRVGLASATFGVETSASRGTRFHGKAVITGDHYLDDNKQQIMGQWPEVELKLWDGKY